MRPEKNVISLLRSIVDLLAEESARNPAFARKLDALISGATEQKPVLKKAQDIQPAESTADIHQEWNNLGEAEFRIWMRGQPLTALRAIIRSQDFDPARRTSKWTEEEKLADFIADALRARLARGAAFIRKDSPGATMPKSGLEISKYFLSALSELRIPITPEELLNPLLEGDEVKDALLRKVNLEMLNMLLGQGMIRAEGPISYRSPIMGLTVDGEKMLAEFRKL